LVQTESRFIPSVVEGMTGGTTKNSSRNIFKHFPCLS